ncbi:MAG: Flp pilus assembly complex ATPase component TadA, partial [Atopostipes suicloacalis]|nr:Flp pilus assembly complex ATPase component TadA [Atopostipes suicloacalis]
SGKLDKKYILSLENGIRLIQYLKYLANMDVGDKRKSQGGSLVYGLTDQSDQDLRLSTIANYHNQESLVIRILESQEQIFLEEHTLLQRELSKIKKLLNYKSGLILFSGPVNSGKTTTIYQLIRAQQQVSDLQIITIEDPVEIEEESFFQIQVNEESGNSYEQSLKASLRHHPDLVVVGEIRDEETAKMAIRAALTGHLILASVHAKNAEGVISRMHELGISLELLKQTLVGIVFQKLLPIYCELCAGDCRAYCTHHGRNGKRASLYDLLESREIQKLNLENLQESARKRTRNFNHLLKKVNCYGYISQNTFKQYYIP